MLAASLTTVLSLFRILVLRLLNLLQELIQTLLGLTRLYIVQAHSILFRHTYLHLGKVTLLFYVAGQHFLFCVHVVIAIEVDCLSASGCIPKILLHAFYFELVSLLRCQFVTWGESLICTDNPLTRAGSTFIVHFSVLGSSTRAASSTNHTLSPPLQLCLVYLVICHMLIDEVGN